MVLLMWLTVINDILDKWRTKQGVFPNILALLVVCLFINFYIVSLPMTWSSRFPTMYRGYIQLLNLPTLYKLARTIEHLLCLTSGLLYMLILSSQGRFLLNFRGKYGIIHRKTQLQKHPIYNKNIFRSLWTQTMYENIVAKNVILSKMSFANGNLF